MVGHLKECVFGHVCLVKYVYEHGFKHVGKHEVGCACDPNFECVSWCVNVCGWACEEIC